MTNIIKTIKAFYTDLRATIAKAMVWGKSMQRECDIIDIRYKLLSNISTYMEAESIRSILATYTEADHQRISASIDSKVASASVCSSSQLSQEERRYSIRREIARTVSMTS